MKESTNPSPEGQSPSQEIDNIINQTGGWKGEKLSRLRAAIKKADPAVVEEVKWKKPSNPMGVPVWSHDGILCLADTLKNAHTLQRHFGQLSEFQRGGRFRSLKRTGRHISLESHGGHVL